MECTKSLPDLCDCITNVNIYDAVLKKLRSLKEIQHENISDPGHTSETMDF